MLLFACSFGRLISAFHKAENCFRRDSGAITVEITQPLSIVAFISRSAEVGVVTDACF